MTSQQRFERRFVTASNKRAQKLAVGPALFAGRAHDLAKIMDQRFSPVARHTKPPLTGVGPACRAGPVTGEGPARQAGPTSVSVPSVTLYLDTAARLPARRFIFQPN